MKPLKRPMFRNGGPLKEGIMHGMQDGGLANNEGPRRAALVGNPMYDQTKGLDGRTRHVVPLVAGLGSAALRFLPAVYRGFKASRAYTPFSQNLGIAGRLKDIFKPSAGIRAAMAEPGAKQGFAVGSLLKSNPLTLGLPTASLLAEGTVGAAKMAPDLLKTYANMVIPFADPFDTSGGPKETKKTDLQRTDKITNVGDVSTKTTPPGGSKDLSDAEKTKLEEDRINSTKQKYYKLMGVDKLNKDAVYNTLIDASTKIREGGNIKDQLKSGDLVSNVINSLSKNLDKSVDLKKQIDAAILKAEITKDVNREKDQLDAQVKRKQLELYDKKLDGLDLRESIASYYDKNKVMPSGSQLASLARVTEGIDAKVEDTQAVKDWMEENNSNEAGYFETLVKSGNLPAGNYVINNRIFNFDGEKITALL